jgi:hypothetical protein
MFATDGCSFSSSTVSTQPLPEEPSKRKRTEEATLDDPFITDSQPQNKRRKRDEIDTTIQSSISSSQLLSSPSPMVPKGDSRENKENVPPIHLSATPPQSTSSSSSAPPRQPDILETDKNGNILSYIPTLSQANTSPTLNQLITRFQVQDETYLADDAEITTPNQLKRNSRSKQQQLLLSIVKRHNQHFQGNLIGGGSGFIDKLILPAGAQPWYITPQDLKLTTLLPILQQFIEPENPAHPKYIIVVGNFVEASTDYTAILCLLLTARMEYPNRVRLLQGKSESPLALSLRSQYDPFLNANKQFFQVCFATMPHVILQTTLGTPTNTSTQFTHISYGVCNPNIYLVPFLESPFTRMRIIQEKDLRSQKSYDNELSLTQKTAIKNLRIGLGMRAFTLNRIPQTSSQELELPSDWYVNCLISDREKSKYLITHQNLEDYKRLHSTSSVTIVNFVSPRIFPTAPKSRSTIEAFNDNEPQRSSSSSTSSQKSLSPSIDPFIPVIVHIARLAQQTPIGNGPNSTSSSSTSSSIQSHHNNALLPPGVHASRLYPLPSILSEPHIQHPERAPRDYLSPQPFDRKEKQPILTFGPGATQNSTVSADEMLVQKMRTLSLQNTSRSSLSIQNPISFINTSSHLKAILPSGCELVDRPFIPPVVTSPTLQDFIATLLQSQSTNTTPSQHELQLLQKTLQEHNQQFAPYIEQTNGRYFIDKILVSSDSEIITAGHPGNDENTLLQMLSKFSSSASATFPLEVKSSHFPIFLGNYLGNIVQNVRAFILFLKFRMAHPNFVRVCRGEAEDFVARMSQNNNFLSQNADLIKTCLSTMPIGICVAAVHPDTKEPSQKKQFTLFVPGVPALECDLRPLLHENFSRLVFPQNTFQTTSSSSTSSSRFDSPTPEDIAAWFLRGRIRKSGPHVTSPLSLTSSQIANYIKSNATDKAALKVIISGSATSAEEYEISRPFKPGKVIITTLPTQSAPHTMANVPFLIFHTAHAISGWKKQMFPQSFSSTSNQFIGMYQRLFSSGSSSSSQ